MDIFKSFERLIGMDETVWARHANRWSVWTRIAGAVPVFLAAWSVWWIGWWSLPGIAAVLVWIWINPRLFPAPDRVDAWASKGVLGERVFLNRDTVPVPAGHRRAALITSSLSAIFALVAVYGFAVQDLVLSATAWAVSAAAKLWFVDRMAWLWEEMKDAHPVYRAWARADWSLSLNEEKA